MAKTSRKRVHQKKWPGVYKYESSKRKIREKLDICYYINFKLDGKLRWEKIGWKSEGITADIASEMRGQRVRAARHGEDAKTAKEIRKERKLKDVSLHEIAEKYFSVRGGDEYSARMDRLRYEKHVRPYVGEKSVSSLTPLEIQKIEKKMQKKAPATVWGALELVRRIGNFGAKNKLCKKMDFIIEMPRRDNEVVEYLKPDELRRLFDVLDMWPNKDPVRMLKLAMYTGMRRKEVFKLKKNDVDFDQKIITLRSPKGGKTVSIPMNAAAEVILKQQIEVLEDACMDTSYVFPGKNGNRRVDCSAVERIHKKANLPRTFRIFHGLRHHFAVSLANSGNVSLDMIGELLTHKSSAMTKRYAQFLPDPKKQTSDMIVDIIANQRNQKLNKREESYVE